MVALVSCTERMTLISGTEFAVKAFVSPDDADYQEAHNRLISESRKLAKLVSPYVVTIYDARKWRGTPYYVMEYLPYSVHDLLRELDGDPCPCEDASVS